MPAPRHNDNATGHQLYSKAPLHRVVVPADVTPGKLAEYARDLADASLWIAARLTVEQNVVPTTDVYKTIGLYAAVAHELHQVAAEIEGETGVKAAPLGKLDEHSYATLIQQQTRALTLTLSQLESAWVSLQARVEVLAEREDVADVKDIKRALTPAEQGGKVLPVLNYLAGHMRNAKRMLRDLAANRAWQMGMNTDDDDPAARIIAVINANKAKEGQE